MPSKPNDADLADEEEIENKEEKKKKRTPVGLDVFDDKVISRMADYRKKSKSEILRFIVSNWIESNPDVLKTNYNINFEEVNKEIIEESKALSPDAIIKQLKELFEMVESISLTELSEHFEMNTKTLKNLIFSHIKEIKQNSLNLTYENGMLIKK